MDPCLTLFTYPRKNPKYSKISELVKTTQYLGLQCHSKKKSDLSDLLQGYYKDLPLRIHIEHNNISYYVNHNCHYKKFLKTYDDQYREVYQLDSSTIRYSKTKKEWDLPKFLRRNKRLDLTRLRNIYIFLEFEHLFMSLYLQDIIIKDIFTYMMTLYRNYVSLPPIIYKVL